VGLVVLILTAGLISAMLWLSVGLNQKTYSTYTVYLHESVAGLTQESPVKYNGVQVGLVKKISLDKNDPRQVELQLDIEVGTPVTTSTSATLISQGITGVTYVGLAAGSSNLTPLMIIPGESYPVIPSKPSLLNQLDSILKEVSENVNKVSNQTHHIFNEENALYIKNSLANMERLTSTFAENSPSINATLKNADIFTANMAKVSRDFPQILKELKIGVSTFNILAQDMSAAGKSVSQTMVTGKNTLDQISQQTLPSAVMLLHRLNAISANLEKVSNDMRVNPSVLIRGTKPPKPGPGE